jgi:hypothetical protein
MPLPEYWDSRFGGGRNQGYEAAKRGDIPTIRIGSRLYVPVAKADRQFGFDTEIPSPD